MIVAVITLYLLKSYTTKRIPGFRRNFYKTMVMYGFPFIGILLGFIFGIIPDTWVLRLVPVAILSWSVAFYRTWLIYRQFECPSCGEQLEMLPEYSRLYIRYKCDSCKTIWDAGIGPPHGV